MIKVKIRSNFQRKTIPRTLWFLILVFFTIFLLLSTIFTVIAYQTPLYTTQETTALTYRSRGTYTYTAYLENNTVYNKTIQRPGEGNIFKEIVKTINGSLFFSFRISQYADISITYQVLATIETDIWTKTYTLQPQTELNETGNTADLTITFPINFEFYDNVVDMINQETDIVAKNPTLYIRIPIKIYGSTVSDYDIFQSINPELSMSLTEKTILFSEELSTEESGTRTQQIQIYHENIEAARTNRLIFTIIIALILLGFIGITKPMNDNRSQIEKELDKIQKKYGEWLVTADSNPVDPLSKTISIKTMEQLSRISEDLGKPMIHYQKNNSKNLFLVIDDDHIYQHELVVSSEDNNDFFSFFFYLKKSFKK